MKLTDKMKSISDLPGHVKAITSVSTVAVVIALIALGVALMAIGSVRHAN